MGRELQKRKRRSSRSTVKQSQRLKRPLNPLGNNIVAKNWNKKETLSQNYRRLGLVARLRTATGGTEKDPKRSRASGDDEKQGARRRAADPFAIASAGQHVLSEVRVERDANGKIVRVLGRRGPLDDPLNEFDSDSEANGAEEGGDEDEWNGVEDDEDQPEVIRELERQANQPVEKPIRHQSEREVEWLQRLVKKHGSDFGAMARDHKLNPMQQTKADIAKRIRKWQAEEAS